MVFECLRRHRERDPGESGALALGMAAGTLEAMARGGMYDRLAGGFARYSVDAAWVVPHFEKMLYDNALLARVYAHWWRRTGSALARRVAADTCAWMIAELRTAQGGFASALDADSDGEEGKFYAWTPGQLRGALGAADGHAPAGPWSGIRPAWRGDPWPWPPLPGTLAGQLSLGSCSRPRWTGSATRKAASTTPRTTASR